MLSTSNEISMYVCLKTLACHRKPYIHAQTYTLENYVFGTWEYGLSMYVCLKTICLSWRVKHTRSNIHASASACMFENPLLVMENDTYTLKHTRSSIFLKSLSVDVCLTPVSIYVCMSEVSKHVCMFPSIYVCLRPQIIILGLGPIPHGKR